MRPLLVPTQIVPVATVEGEMDSIAPPGGAGRSSEPALPAVRPASDGAWLFGTPRSGLSLFQCTPPSVVAMRYWKPARSSCEFHGAHTSGPLNALRSLSCGFSAGLTLIHCSLGYMIFTTPEPVAYTASGVVGSGTTVPHSHPGTGLQSSGVISPRSPRARVRMAPASCCDA